MGSDESGGSTSERGTAAVEFALVSVLLITLVLGGIEFGWAFFLQGNVAGAAREGARYYAIFYDPLKTTDETDAKNRVVAADPLGKISTGMVNLTDGCPTTYTGLNKGMVTVDVALPYKGLTGFFPFPANYTIKGSAAMRCKG